MTKDRNEIIIEVNRPNYTDATSSETSEAKAPKEEKESDGSDPPEGEKRENYEEEEWIRVEWAYKPGSPSLPPKVGKWL